ncbi:hypothetical protein [Pseudomonas sp. 2FE]|uniref:hypothetical protein n=1 Tax=Pseudomonas sp. 2FE TaxID=2502190 RepID=UPI0010F71909|nr:hypothetical protein [Pseudomonas sp. 2FE]
MKKPSQGLWLALHSSFDETPSYLHFAGPYLESLLERAETLVGTVDQLNLSEARMYAPAVWAMFSSSVNEWNHDICDFPSMGMELACTGRLNLWLTSTGKEGNAEVDTSPFTLEELRQAVDVWKETKSDLFSVGYQQLDAFVIDEIVAFREARAAA